MHVKRLMIGLVTLLLSALATPGVAAAACDRQAYDSIVTNRQYTVAGTIVSIEAIEDEDGGTYHEIRVSDDATGCVVILDVYGDVGSCRVGGAMRTTDARSWYVTGREALGNAWDYSAFGTFRIGTTAICG